MLIDDLYLDLKSKVSENRYNHVVRVLETARKIAIKYNVSQEKLEIAVLLHDILKEENIGKLEEMCKGYDYKELEIKEAKSVIIHGFAAAVYAIEKYNIYDMDILNAVKYHTIGRGGMSLLEKIVYIADGIEPARNYPQVNEIRELVKNDIDEAMLYEIERKILYLSASNKAIHPNAYEIRNWLLEVAKRRNETC